MQTPDDEHVLLQRLLAATRAGEIQWNEEDGSDTWYIADIGSTLSASFRFLRYEATNQIGADPMAIQFGMPGLNAVYFAGTSGYQIFREILSVAFEKWRPAPDPSVALRLFEEGLIKLRSLGAN